MNMRYVVWYGKKKMGKICEVADHYLKWQWREQEGREWRCRQVQARIWCSPLQGTRWKNTFELIWFILVLFLAAEILESIINQGPCWKYTFKLIFLAAGEILESNMNKKVLN